ncbi:MAG: hypothetical protein RR348_01390 [Clostridia bacterium]
MKRKSLIFVALVLSIIMVTAFAGCKSLKEKDLFALADFTEPSNEKSRDVAITVETTDGAGAAVVIYQYKNGELLSKPLDGFDFSGLVLADGGAPLKFDNAYFSAPSYVIGKDDIAIFSATIADSASFLGISDIASGSVEIKANVDTKQLISTKVTYSKNGASKVYNVTLETVMVY